MITFGNMIVEGFCSISHLELNLSSKSITIIRGATGEGKTTILSALVWCIYGKNLKGKSDVNTWEKYRTKSYQGTKVELYFTKNGKTHKVIRCLKYKGDVNGAKGKDRLVYEIEAEEVKPKNKNDIQSLIVSDLGMSYNLFMNSVMFGQGMKRLIQESSNDKRSLFEEMLDLDYISKARDITKGYLIQEKDVESNADYELKKAKAEYDRIEDILEDLNHQLVNANKDITSKIKAHKEKFRLLAKAKKSIDHKGLIAKLNYLKEDINNLKEKQNSVQLEITSARNKTKVSLEEFIDVIIKLLKSGDIKSSLKRLKEVKDAFGKVNKLTDEVQDIYDKLSNLRDKKEDIEDKLSEYHELCNKQNREEIEIDRLVKERKRGVNTNLIDKYQKQAKKLKAEIGQLQEKLKHQSKVVSDYEWVMNDPLGNRGIKAFLFESSLDNLNEVLGSYSEVLGFNILFYVDIQGVKKDFNTMISMDGIEVSYEELSGGQKQLANLAMAFAMNEVMTESKGINIAFLDEVFENLSSEYIELVINLIRKIYKDKTLFLISHHESLPIPNARILNVTREKGISQYY